MSEYTIVKTAYDQYMKYFSQASQDKFVAKMLNFKKNGFVVDVGSSGDSSNSYFFDQFLDWKCICVDQLDDNYVKRKNTKFYKGDATKLDYADMFKANGFPNVIDYLSLDVDKETNIAMKLLPYDDYRFSIITIEHDAYVCGDERRADQREFLESKGYYCLCKNIWFFVHDGKNVYFEDWWVDPKTLDMEKLKHIESCDEHVDAILTKIE